MLSNNYVMIMIMLMFIYVYTYAIMYVVFDKVIMDHGYLILMFIYVYMCVRMSFSDKIMIFLC